ncbi:MAG: translation initiation factor [Lewinellaceae bacterium]|nr:translation initiation factor [Lewinellaceae bacterium]
MAKNKTYNDFGSFVFSTNPDFKPPEKEEPEQHSSKSQQNLRIWLERHKGNKESTVIKGFEGSDADMAELARTLKSKCASGGNAKNGVIILQGDHRDKVLKLLLDMGYSKTKKAGG